MTTFDFSLRLYSHQFINQRGGVTSCYKIFRVELYFNYVNVVHACFPLSFGGLKRVSLRDSTLIECRKNKRVKSKLFETRWAQISRACCPNRLINKKKICKHSGIAFMEQHLTQYQPYKREEIAAA